MSDGILNKTHFPIVFPSTYVFSTPLEKIPIPLSVSVCRNSTELGGFKISYNRQKQNKVETFYSGNGPTFSFTRYHWFFVFRTVRTGGETGSCHDPNSESPGWQLDSELATSCHGPGRRTDDSPAVVRRCVAARDSEARALKFIFTPWPFSRTRSWTQESIWRGQNSLIWKKVVVLIAFNSSRSRNFKLNSHHDWGHGCQVTVGRCHRHGDGWQRLALAWRLVSDPQNQH